MSRDDGRQEQKSWKAGREEGLQMGNSDLWGGCLFLGVCIVPLYDQALNPGILVSLSELLCKLDVILHFFFLKKKLRFREIQ